MKSVGVLYLLLPLIIHVVSGIMPLERLGKRFATIALAVHEYCLDTTGVSQKIIDGVKYGIFPDEPLIQDYNYCLWRTSEAIDEDDRLTITFVRNMCEAKVMQDFDVYVHCNEDALNLRFCLGETSSVLKIWEMQKCIFKNVSEERFIYI